MNIKAIGTDNLCNIFPISARSVFYFGRTCRYRNLLTSAAAVEVFKNVYSLSGIFASKN